MRRIRVGVVMGGSSFNYEESLRNGEVVLNNIDRNQYEVLPIVINQKGEWSISVENLIDKIDVAILMTYEASFRDSIHHIFDYLGIPYIGSNSLAINLGINKSATANILKANGLLVPKALDISKHSNWSKMNFAFEFPVVVKPMDKSASLGISIANNERDLRHSLCEVFSISNHARIEEYIPGKEIVCGVVDCGNDFFALTPSSASSKEAWFLDKASKNNAESLIINTPAKISNLLIDKAKETAIIAHKAIQARGITNTDMILGVDNNLYVLEINTLPSFLPYHPLAYSLEHMGLKLSHLIDRLILDAITRRG